MVADSQDGQPRFIEVCCGSAGLSSAFIAAGVPALGIDWGGNQHKPKAPWIVLDLSTPNGLTSLLALLEANTAVQAVWLGLPCGTASRAREIPGPGMPRPLRTTSEPWGRTDIKFTATEAERMSKANAIYRAGLAVIAWCTSKNVGWAIENPFNSLLWFINEFVDLLNLPGAADACYQACMVGGRRDKRQRLRGTVAAFNVIDGKWCDKSHQHLPWKSAGKLMTSTEAEYPDLFCKILADEFVKLNPKPITIRTSGAPTLAAAAALCAKAPANQATRVAAAALQTYKASARAAAGSQPRYGAFPQLIREYRQVMLISSTASEVVHSEWRLAAAANKGWVTNDIQLLQGSVLKGWRILRVLRRDGGSMEEDCAEDAPVLIHIGLPWTVAEFHEQAKEATHPFAGQAVVPDRTLEAVFEVFTKGPVEMASIRQRALEKWTRRAAAELDADERALFAKAPAGIQAAWGGHRDPRDALKGPWKGKRSLLLAEMAAAAGVPNPELIAAYIQRGAPAFGEVPASGLFGERDHPATKTFKEVLQASKWSRPQL